MNDLIDEVITAPHAKALEVLSAASDADLEHLLESKDSEILSVLFRVADQRLANRIFSLLTIENSRVALEQAQSDSVGNILSYITPNILSDLLPQSKNELVEKLLNTARSSNVRERILKSLPPPATRAVEKICTGPDK